MNPKSEEEENMKKACESIIINNDVRKIKESELGICNENIGEGGQGEVYFGTFEGKPVAVKKLSKIDWKGFAHELIILSCVEHENIPKFYGIVLENDKIDLVFQHIDGMTLDEYLNDDSNSKVSDQQKLKIAKETCNAIEYIHSYNIVHRDLKPENIMVDKSGKSYIIDFGISKVLGDSSSVDTNAKGTFYFLAPEIIADSQPNDQGGIHAKISSKIDVWSYGLILSYLFSGTMPWTNKKGCTDSQILLWLSQNSKFPIPKSIENKQIHNIIEKSTICDKNERPTISEIKKLLEEVKFNDN